MKGEILLKNGVFRQATFWEWLKYYQHQFVLDYGIDAGIYLIGVVIVYRDEAIEYYFGPTSTN